MEQTALWRGNHSFASIRPMPGLAGDGRDQLETAQEAEREQQAILEAAPIEQTYQEALSIYVRAKFAQVEHIEDRLENLIDRQQTRLQQIQTAKPGFLARPGARQAWQMSQTQQQARLQVLHARLDVVREIKEGMGLHAPKIEELATRKMRAARPELVADWNAMREAVRRHQSLLRDRERDRKKTQTQGQRSGRAQTLGLFHEA